MAQELNQPVAVVCTSGTASLNYGPAIAEAFYQKIPLLVITADRPKEVIDQGEGQSIRQEFVFKNHTLSSVNLLLDQGLESQERFNQDQINLALTSLTHDVDGPVHINIPLEEELYGTVSIPKQFPKVLDSKVKKFTLDKQQIESIKNILQALSLIHI